MKGLDIWTVYENPTDYPGKFVARLWRGTEPTDEVMVEDDLYRLRTRLALIMHLTCLPRQRGDDRAIVETWL